MPSENYRRPQDIRSVAVIGTGSVGASWAALFLAHGMEVLAHDPSEGAPARAIAFVQAAWPALVALKIAQEVVPPIERLRFCPTAGEAAALADLIQENVPENPALKARVLAEISGAAGPEKIILSSTGGIPPSQLQEACAHPERFVVVHPFNPSHLIALVEVVGGRTTSAAVVEWALEFARHVGKQPIRLHVEAAGHMTNRLQFALVREAVHCLVEGVASARDIDAAVRYGLAPRWTLMGSLLTLHLAGGPGGMQGILDHAGQAIETWWTPMSQPQLTPEVTARLVRASAEVSDGQAIDQWVAWRDEQLVNVIKLQAASEQDEPRRSQKGQA